MIKADASHLLLLFFELFSISGGGISYNGFKLSAEMCGIIIT